MYHQTTPFIIFISVKRERMGYFQSQTANNVAENVDFNFRAYKIFSYLLSFVNASSTKFMSAFASFSNNKYF